MSANTPRDLNMLPESEKEIESSTNGGFHKPQTEHNDENLGEQRKKSCPLVEISPNENGTVVSVTEVPSAEVEYIESENLDDVEDVDTSLEARVFNR